MWVTMVAPEVREKESDTLRSRARVGFRESWWAPAPGARN